MKPTNPKHTVKQLAKHITHKNVLITGSSSGIGKKTAEIFAKAGANVILVARNPEKLATVENELQAHAHRPSSIASYPCDLTDLDAVKALAKKVLATHGHVDVLINNAGRSIRRPISQSLERFHDYQRTMQLNYFSVVKLTHALLPNMLTRKQGHIINISSYGVLMGSPFFSAYIASKAALDAYSRSLAAEVKHKGIQVTTLNFPLVRTPMIAPTRLYNYIPTLNTFDAAINIAKAVINKPSYDSTKLAKLAAITNLVAPKVNLSIQALSYRLTPRLGVKRSAKKSAKRQKKR